MDGYKRPDDAKLREILTPLQFKVVREDGTEPAFSNEFWDNHREGIYVDIVSGEPLFSSRDKFDSGTGWPSFTKPIEGQGVVEKKDRSFFMTRIEVRSARRILILGMSLMTDHSPQVYDIALIPHRCASFRLKISKRKATASTGSYSSKKDRPGAVMFRAACFLGAVWCRCFKKLPHWTQMHDFAFHHHTQL